jgi:AsmA protein
MRQTKKLRVYLRAGAILGALALIWVLPALIVNTARLRSDLEAQLSKTLGRRVAIGRISPPRTLRPGRLRLLDVSVADDPAFGGGPFFSAGSVTVAFDVFSLLSGSVRLTGISVDWAKINFLRSADGTWNFASLGVKSATSAATGAYGMLEISSVRIANSFLSVRYASSSAQSGTFVRVSSRSEAGSSNQSQPANGLDFEAVQLSIPQFDPESDSDFTFTANATGGGNIDARGQIGAIARSDLLLTAIRANVNVRAIKLDCSGWNTACGPLSASISVESNGNHVKINGGLRIPTFRLSNEGQPAHAPLIYNFSADHNLVDGSGSISRGEIPLLARNFAHMTGSYTRQNGRTLWNLDLDTPNLPVTPLSELLPCMGLPLPAGSSLTEGTIKWKLKLQGFTGQLTGTGSIDAYYIHFSGYDLGNQLTAAGLSGIQTGSRTEIHDFSADLRITPDQITLEGIKAVIPGVGQFTGSGIIEHSGPVAFKLDAVLPHGTTPFNVEGSFSKPIFRTADQKR